MMLFTEILITEENFNERSDLMNFAHLQMLYEKFQKRIKEERIKKKFKSCKFQQINSWQSGVKSWTNILLSEIEGEKKTDFWIEMWCHLKRCLLETRMLMIKMICLKESETLSYSNRWLWRVQSWCMKLLMLPNKSKRKSKKFIENFWNISPIMKTQLILINYKEWFLTLQSSNKWIKIHLKIGV